MAMADINKHQTSGKKKKKKKERRPLSIHPLYCPDRLMHVLGCQFHFGWYAMNLL